MAIGLADLGDTGPRPLTILNEPGVGVLVSWALNNEA